MEDEQYSALKSSLSSVSAKTLSNSSRVKLANKLDNKQAIISKHGVCRDYRGLADLMGIPVSICMRFEKSESPTEKLLEIWETSPNATLDKLLTFLEMGRYDVIEEIVPFLEKNTESYLQYQRSLESPIQVAKAKHLNLSLAEKRRGYLCKKYVTLDEIKPWSEHGKTVTPYHCPPVCSKNPKLNEKVSIFIGDITALEIDAIVNAANNALGGGFFHSTRDISKLRGVDGAIHRAAGPKLLEECKTLHVRDTGDAKITGGYRLPAKYVIQTVGPIGENKEDLASCYRRSLTVALENNVRTVAFPCISTGGNCYPNDKAAPVAIKTVREMLEQNESSFDRIIFCLFLPVDVAIYESVMQEYFPILMSI